MRAFYIDEEGDEINVSFISEGNFAVHFAALTQHKPSKYYFQAIESVVIINLSYRHLIECCERFHSIERYLRIMMGRELVFKQERIDSFIFDNAETRYLNFIKDNPSLYNRIALTQLSSYLGIERQTLTRIRKKLLDN